MPEASTSHREDLAERLRGIALKLRRNDSEFKHFEPLPPKPHTKFALQLASFGLFENDDFQTAFRECLFSISGGNVGGMQQQQPSQAWAGYESEEFTDFTEHSISLTEGLFLEDEFPTVASAMNGTHSNSSSRRSSPKNKNSNEETQFLCAPVPTNTSVSKVTLRALPEPDLKLALQAVSFVPNLQDLQILQCPQSQCIPVQEIIRFLITLQQTHHNAAVTAQHSLRGLRRIHISTRIHVKTQSQLDQLAQALELHKHSLEHVYLHLLPRCSSIQRPDMNLNSVFEALCSHTNRLRTCRFILGYNHNPFGKPLISVAILQKIFCNSPKLRKLQLDNFGFQNSHFKVLVQVLQNSVAPQLQELQLARNYRSNHHSSTNQAFGFTPEAIEEICDVLVQSNFKLTKVNFLSHDEMMQCQEHIDQVTAPQNNRCSSKQCCNCAALLYTDWVQAQRRLNLYTRLNQLNRNELMRQHEHNAEKWIQALSSPSGSSSVSSRKKNREPNTEKTAADPLLDLDVVYTLLRTNPAILIKSPTKKRKQITALTKDEVEFGKEKAPTRICFPSLSSSLLEGLRVTANPRFNFREDGADGEFQAFDKQRYSHDYMIISDNGTATNNQIAKSARATDMNQFCSGYNEQQVPTKVSPVQARDRNTLRNNSSLELQRRLDMLLSDPKSFTSEESPSTFMLESDREDDSDEDVDDIMMRDLDDSDSLSKYQKSLRRSTGCISKRPPLKTSSRKKRHHGDRSSAIYSTNIGDIVLPALTTARNEAHPHRLRHPKRGILKHS